VSARGSALGPPRARRATPRQASRSETALRTTGRCDVAVFLAPDCPARGHRV
jgi:hypothetical protein